MKTNMAVQSKHNRLQRERAVVLPIGCPCSEELLAGQKSKSPLFYRAGGRGNK